MALIFAWGLTHRLVYGCWYLTFIRRYNRVHLLPNILICSSIWSGGVCADFAQHLSVFDIFP